MSIYSALSLALAGSESDTREELVSVLSLDAGKDINAIVQSLGAELGAVTCGDAKKALVEANGVFIQSGSHIKETYTSAVSKHLRAAFKELDFSGDAEGSRASIN
ncbi:unnamed protein product, partial [Hydatigera taeniaeformis]|uniref:SERPIN domain-containing protein n=1 Tax=Hydatigena taeniaeformis TaxID=6205 RepID=A0A0R3WTT6_HYDTA